MTYKIFATYCPIYNIAKLATVPKENVQPEEPSTICISVFREKSICCAKKAGSIKGVTSDMAHGQTYNKDVKESASGLT